MDKAGFGWAVVCAPPAKSLPLPQRLAAYLRSSLLILSNM
jgi:hypothetical protein